MAAINFPSSPSNGDVHTENGATYEYETSTTSWLKVPSTWINDGAYVYYDGALNVGIGTTTPSTKLHVVGTTLLAGETDVTGDFAVNTDAFWVNASNGRVGIGTTSPSVALEVNGHVAATRVIVGEGSGAVALTTNDGQGNANLTFNHASGIPDFLGNGGRIVVNTDATASPSMAFELGSAVTAGVAYNTSQLMRLDNDGITVTGTVDATSYTGDGSALTGISGGTTWELKTTTYTAVAGDAIIADTSGGIWTLTLPATPSTGDYIQILDGADWNANNLTVARNGQTIEGDAENMIMNIGNVAVDFIFDGTTWQITVQIGPTASIYVTETGTQTLTNKTLTSAILDGTTTSGPINVTGTVAATDFTGDGSALTGVSATTNLGYNTAASTGTVTSSGGTDATLPAATTSLAGLLTGTDKTKLNGIETSADVTDATNVTTAGALMDSEVTNLAQVKAFDTTDYATAAQGSTADTAVQPASTNTLTNKTLTNVVLDGSVTEEVFAVTGTTPALDPVNGTIQTWTLSGASTPTENLATGESMTVMIDDGTANTITWPTMTWVNNAGSAPTLATTGYTVVALWKVSTTLYGALIGDGT